MKKRVSNVVESNYPVYFLLLFAFSLMSFFFSDIKIAIAETAICILAYVWYRILAHKRERKLQKYVEEIVSAVKRTGKDSLTNIPMASVIVKHETSEILWGNSAFEAIAKEHDYIFEQQLFDLIPEFDLSWVSEGKYECPGEVKINDKIYRVYGNLYRNESKEESMVLLQLYWLDITDYSTTITEFENSRQMVGVIMVDNFDELMNGLSAAEQSTIIAEIDKKLAEWTADANGIFLRYERGRYLYIFQQRHLESYVEEKFSVLNNVKTIEGKNGINVTLSIGIGKDGQDFKENHHNARLAIDMALSRGGDQAVIRNKFNFEFFGGRTKEVEKRTKVKSRVMANALAGLIRDSSAVMIMGHKNADNDSIGAAVGIACIARKIGKRAYIAVGQNTSADALVKKMRTIPEYEDVFIDAEDALIKADGDTLVVVVDTNRTSVVESESLLESANKIAVIDHHRRGADYIEGAVLNFHEPYASSACELVTELLQYIVEVKDVLAPEAEAMLSGIVIDTKKFTMKTGVRTFEAAAYLRRAGADATELKRIMQDDIEIYVKRAELVKVARMYKGKVAIVEYDGESTRVIAAQAADELLSIKGVQASFVLYQERDSIVISARSLGKINVQLVLEKLGGGGHFDTAGAQVKEKTLKEVSSELMQAIDEVVE